ncbi:hypothetical protein [Nonomuraea typhae]|uniref:hypothetical protein n=1 Tax=Nonomuraea typhae TaxID=2603600 RepID=UPI001CA53DDD|nr:hypothetical protein [Nonomuraea typhae]
MPETDPRVCRAAWYAAARAAGGQVGRFLKREYPRNFHTATISGRDGEHVALFHSGLPLVAFVDEERYRYDKEFLDPPAWAESIGDFGFAVLDRSLLLAPLTEAHTAELSGAEPREIRYWRAETVGATLFNSWD